MSSPATRMLENFHISGVPLRLYPNLIKAFAMVKMAAARANFDCGQFSKEILTGMEKACQEIINGKLQNVLCETNMGATAIGTGLNAPDGYAQKCTDHLAKITGMPIHLAPDLIEATQDTQAFVLYSSTMKSLAIKLSKVCNDLRLLSSGPRCGFREINLPAKQPGSSIMPGKVNPVIPEVVNMVCFRVIGSDLTVTMAAEGGQLQLNVFEPVIAACIFEAQTLFINAARTLRVHCVEGITANEDIVRHYVEYSIGTVTALNPVIGYERATELAAEAMKTGRGIMELIREKKILTEEQIARVLDPAAMTGQGRRTPGLLFVSR